LRKPPLSRIEELRIERVGARGDGIGRLPETNDGRPVYVPYTAPGDLVRVALGETRGDGVGGRLVELIEAGSGRCQPACVHFGSCGGCALQQLNEETYAAWKVEQAIAALAHRGLVAERMLPLLRTAPGTRRRATFAALGVGRGVVIGFHARGSGTIVDVSACPVLIPNLVGLLPGLRRALVPLLSGGKGAEIVATWTETGADLLVVSTRPPDLAARQALVGFAESQDLARLSWAAPGEEPEPVAQRRLPRLTWGKVAVTPPPGAFLQPSLVGESALVEAVCAAVGNSKQVADLYAGCGTFTFPLAVLAKVHAVEGDKVAAAALMVAARGAGLGNRIAVERRDLERDPLSAAELKSYDAVVFDPPRAGAKRLCDSIAASSVPLVVAVSCHAPSFARDARILVDGGYRLESVRPVDQFLWSAHVELVAILRR